MRARQIVQRCSFCGKSRDQVDRLVAGPGVFICDRCVALCQAIVNEPPPPVSPPPLEAQEPLKSPAGRRGWLGRWLRSEGLQLSH